MYAMTFDPIAAEDWLRQPAPAYPHITRAESFGIDDLFSWGREGFLAIIDDVLAVEPARLRRRSDIDAIGLWLNPDADILDRGVLINVDLANSLRLVTLRQDLNDFADRDRYGIAAVLSALAHIADQATIVVDQYEQTTHSGDVS